MYISKKELLKIAKDNKFRACVDYTKPQLFVRLRSEGLLPEGVNENDKDPDRYNFLKGIKDRTKKVEVRDLETGEISTYSSMYKCAKASRASAASEKWGGTLSEGAKRPSWSRGRGGRVAPLPR